MWTWTLIVVFINTNGGLSLTTKEFTSELSCNVALQKNVETFSYPVQGAICRGKFNL